MWPATWATWQRSKAAVEYGSNTAVSVVNDYLRIERLPWDNFHEGRSFRCRQTALWPELRDGTLAGNQRSGHPCVHPDDEPVEAPARASFCADSKGASSAGLVQKMDGDESDCSFENGYCSVSPNDTPVINT